MLIPSPVLKLCPQLWEEPKTYFVPIVPTPAGGWRPGVDSPADVGDERISCVDIRGKHPQSRDIWNQGPEAGMCLECLQNQGDWCGGAAQSSGAGGGAAGENRAEPKARPHKTCPSLRPLPSTPAEPEGHWRLLCRGLTNAQVYPGMFAAN